MEKSQQLPKSAPLFHSNCLFGLILGILLTFIWEINQRCSEKFEIFNGLPVLKLNCKTIKN